MDCFTDPFTYIFITCPLKRNMHQNEINCNVKLSNKWHRLLKQYWVYWKTVKYIGSEWKYPAPQGFRKWWSVSFFLAAVWNTLLSTKKRSDKMAHLWNRTWCMSLLREECREKSQRESLNKYREWHPEPEGKKTDPGLAISLNIRLQEVSLCMPQNVNVDGRRHQFE